MSVWRRFGKLGRSVPLCGAAVYAATIVWGSVFSYLTVPSVVVPALVGTSLEQVHRIGEAHGVVVEAERSVAHPSALEGEVIEQSIAAGARVRRGRRVAVTVSRGPTLVPVPYLRGRPLSLALPSLDLLQLQASVSTAEHDEWINAGSVSWQHPAPGTLVPTDTVITVVVSLGRSPHAAGRGMPGSRRQGAAPEP